MKGKLIKQEEHYILLIVEQEEFERIFATTNPFLLENKNKLSLKNCESIENGYDLNQLAEEWIDANGKKWSNNNNEVGDNYGSFKAGFLKAIEIMVSNKFTAEDMRKAFSYGMDVYAEPNDWDEINPYQKLNNHIQSQQQNSWDVEVEMKKVIDETKIVGTIKGVKGSGNKITTYKSDPKLDENNCLILKRIK